MTKNRFKQEEKKKKFPKYFLSFILLLVLSLSAAVFYGWKIIDEALIDYEKHLPTVFIKEYFENLSKGDYTQAIGLCGFEKNEFTSENDFKQYFDGLYSDGYNALEYIKKAENSLNGTMEYDIYSGTSKKGHLVIKKTGKKSKYGFDYWEIIESNLIEYIHDIKITVPQGAKAHLNDIEIPSKFLTDVVKNDTFPVAKTKDISSDYPYYQVYKISGMLIAEPIVTVLTNDGEPCVQIEKKLEKPENESEEGHRLTESFVFSLPDKNKDRIVDIAQKAMARYVECISKATEMDPFFKYVLKDTKLYNKLKNYNSSWYIAQPEYSGEEIGEYKISNYKEFSDTQISLHIQFDYTIYTYKNTQKTVYPISYTLYFLKTDNDWKIFQMDIA